MHTVIPASLADFEGIWEIVHAELSHGDTYCYDPDLTPEEAKEIFFAPKVQQYKIVVERKIAGFFYLRPNFHKRGNHVANAGFMVHPDFRKLGIGRALGEAALRIAKAEGYQAMQFNTVISSNLKAVALWKSLGFLIIGTVPQAFQHRTQGLIDVYIMHRFL
jgi:GNAT superfamily N-acetyltransferase